MSDKLQNSLRMLNAELISRLDEALCQVGAFGEVRLIVVKGRLRFMQTMASESLEYTPQARGER